MKNIKYISPDGEVVENPNIETLFRLISTLHEEYWGSESGQGSLIWYSDKKSPLASLLLTFSSKYGFYLEHIDERIKYDSHIALGEGDLTHENATEVFICGEALLLPSAFFIPANQVCLAVKEFLDSGNKVTDIKWVKERSLGWDYGDPEGFVQ